MATKLYIMTPTYNRHQEICWLLTQIENERNDYTIEMHVWNDGGCTPNYPHYDWLTWHDVSHHGKERFWQLIQKMWDNAKVANADYFYYIPDDQILLPRFFRESIAAWRAIEDMEKICLSYYIPPWRKGKWSWNKSYTVKEITNGGYDFWDMGWVDMRFLCGRQFFEVLGWSITPIANRWDKKPWRSSGVGGQISRRLHKKGYSMYGSRKNFAYEVPHEKTLNPEGQNYWDQHTGDYREL